MDKRGASAQRLQTRKHHQIKGCGVAASILAAIISSFLVVSPVFATDPDIPSPFIIGTPKVFRHIFETDDYLLVFPYEITYSSGQPNRSASELFTYRLIDDDGVTTLGTVVPYAYNNYGYGKGVAAIYFAESSAPDWYGLYTIRIDGNPVYWDSPPTTTHTLSAAEYYSGTTPEANKGALAAFILIQASALEINWGVKLYDSNSTGGISLTSTGQAYFTSVIPGLISVCPSIMNSSVSTPEYTATNNPGTSAAYNWLHQWDGTILENWGNNIGGHLGGLNWQGVTAGILFIFFVALAGLSQVKFGTTDVAYIASGADLIIATFAGFIWYAIMGAIFIALLWYVSHTQFWRNM
jgi:hypothetical protein